MRLPWLILPLLFASFSNAQDVYATFAKNDAEVAERSFVDPLPPVVQNLDILVDAVRKADRKSLTALLKKFGDLAKKNDQGFATSFGWVAGEKVSAGTFTAIAVSYGPIGKVVVFEASDKVRDDVALTYMVQRAPHILSLTEHELIVGSQFVRDAGMRDNTQIQSFRINLGRHTGADSLTLVKSLEIEHTLEWGGARVKEGRLILESIDSPKSFILANTEAVLKRTRTYSISRGELVLQSDKPGDLPLRAVDDWLRAAQTASRPDPKQRQARRAIPEPELLLDYTVQQQAQKATVVFETDRGKLTFQLSKTPSGFVVRNVTVK